MVVHYSVSDAKRSITREALALKSGALLQLAEKTVVVAEITKLLVDEIPSDRTEPGHTRAQYEGELAGAVISGSC